MPPPNNILQDRTATRLGAAPHTPQDALAQAHQRITDLEQALAMERTERLLLARRLRAAEQGVPLRYARHTADWADVDLALDADRGGQ